MNMMKWNIDALKNSLIKNFSNNIDVTDVQTYRSPDASLSLSYRVIYFMKKGCSPYNIGHIKYAMFVKWGDGNKFAIVIGQNPSVSKTIKSHTHNVDDTNWNIIKFLKYNKFDGYIMINTIPLIQPNGKQMQNINQLKENDINIKISEFILNNSKKIPIILACTTRNFISSDFFHKIIIKRKKTQILIKQDSPKIIVTHFASQFLNSNKIKLNGRFDFVYATPRITETFGTSFKLCKIDFLKEFQ